MKKKKQRKRRVGLLKSGFIVNCLLSPEGHKVPSLKIIRFSSDFLFALSVGANKRPRTTMSSSV